MHYVFARKDKDLLAVSNAIKISEKSEHILPDMTLTKKKYALGSVWKHQNGNSPVPFAGAKVSFGPFEAETDDIGKFSIPSLGSGKVALSVNGEGHIARNEFVDVKDNGFLNKPVIMYAEGFLSGDIVPINEYEQASELDSRKPFKRSFYVYSSDGASRVRFHHDKELLKSGKVEWRELRDIMSYNFTGASRQLLYVQFANSDLSRQSEITFYSFYLDALSLSDGFYVNDGSGRIFTRHVELTIDVPPTAESMRISQSAAGITAAPWERASTKSPFVQLRSNLDLTTGTINANGIYDIYLQFADVNGNISNTYKYTAFMELFPVEWRVLILQPMMFLKSIMVYLFQTSTPLPLI